MTDKVLSFGFSLDPISFLKHSYLPVTLGAWAGIAGVSPLLPATSPNPPPHSQPAAASPAAVVVFRSWELIPLGVTRTETFSRNSINRSSHCFPDIGKDLVSEISYILLPFSSGEGPHAVLGQNEADPWLGLFCLLTLPQ